MASDSNPEEGPPLESPSNNDPLSESVITQHHSNASSRPPSNLTPSQQRALSHLLNLCASNNLSINPHLRRAILGEELYDEAACKGRVSRGNISKRESLLGSLIASHQTDLEEEYLSETARRVREKIDELERSDISLEVRVKGGGYAVTVPAASSEKGIETVASTGALMGLARRLGSMLTCNGSGGAKQETKVIMDGVNLFLEEGKMYLVLGAPGEMIVIYCFHCGVSIVATLASSILVCSHVTHVQSSSCSTRIWKIDPPQNDRRTPPHILEINPLGYCHC